MWFSYLQISDKALTDASGTVLTPEGPRRGITALYHDPQHCVWVVASDTCDQNVTSVATYQAVEFNAATASTIIPALGMINQRFACPAQVLVAPDRNSNDTSPSSVYIVVALVVRAAAQRTGQRLRAVVLAPGGAHELVDFERLRPCADRSNGGFGEHLDLHAAFVAALHPESELPRSTTHTATGHDYALRMRYPTPTTTDKATTDEEEHDMAATFQEQEKQRKVLEDTVTRLEADVVRLQDSKKVQTKEARELRAEKKRLRSELKAQNAHIAQLTKSAMAHDKAVARYESKIMKLEKTVDVLEQTVCGLKREAEASEQLNRSSKKVRMSELSSDSPLPQLLSRELQHRHEEIQSAFSALSHVVASTIKTSQ